MLDLLWLAPTYLDTSLADCQLKLYWHVDSLLTREFIKTRVTCSRCRPTTSSPTTWLTPILAMFNTKYLCAFEPNIFVFQVPSNYQFTYHVADTYSGDVHHHSETKSEHKTEGQYSVKLPDGRTQVRWNKRKSLKSCDKLSKRHRKLFDKAGKLTDEES